MKRDKIALFDMDGTHADYDRQLWKDLKSHQNMNLCRSFIPIFPILKRDVMLSHLR